MKASQCYFTRVDINRNMWFDKEFNVKRKEFKQALHEFNCNRTEESKLEMQRKIIL